ncbi:MAG TPA: hypothetical protein VMC06_08065 [Opitutaceae bacterium]|nr:hypothetical protein [Opitutaceae bacterium]
MRLILRLTLLSGALAGFAAGALGGVAPVTFVFELPADERNPYARDLWADVVLPSQQTLTLPVFFFGSGRFAVRARASAAGDYRLGRVVETVNGQPVVLVAKPVGGDRVTTRDPEDRPAIHCAAGSPPRLVFATGGTYTPVGANLAWASTGRVQFHLDAFNSFAREGLNWTRIWMVHWSGLNLDWLPEDMGPSPAPGDLDQRVAADWDRIVADAEARGIYLQMVLQHHGQFSTGTNPSWKDHPWNAAHPGGFLRTPGEFFTSPVAIRLTTLKYRYIVARWGYSPAILAWELFNEVHWTDAFNVEHNEAAVARWHSAMAAYLRLVDVYHHLVTTSTENLRSPIYRDMDYFQPHLYAANMLAGARAIVPAPAMLDRPVFYGEVGDDHMELTPEQQAAGVAIVPPVWASLMGLSRYPAQPWLGAHLLAQGRLGELGAVARFLAATKLGERDGLAPFSPVVGCPVRVPLVLVGGQMWQRRPGPDITVPLDGRELIEFADIPRIYVGSPGSLAEGYPGRAVYHFDFPRATTLRPRVAGIGAGGSAIRVSLDGHPVVEKSWPARRAAPAAAAPEFPVEFSFPVSAGRHDLVVENPGAPDWFDLTRIDLGLDIPALAAVGKRDASFIALWVWHREGVFAVDAPPPATGTLLVDDVPAGRWRITWWNSLTGVPARPTIIEHGGGVLKLPTPAIARHAAVVLER